jgi:hypothetical protein
MGELVYSLVVHNLERAGGDAHDERRIRGPGLAGGIFLAGGGSGQFTYTLSMRSDGRSSQSPGTIWRAVIDIAFIIFLYYSNLLMGEFTHKGGHGKSLMFAVRDVITPTNFAIGICSALIGFTVFEFLRRNL